MRRFHPYICSVVARELRQHDWRVEAEAKERMIQQIYGRLLANSAQALAAYRGREENSVYRYLEIIAIRVVLTSTSLRQEGSVHESFTKL